MKMFRKALIAVVATAALAAGATAATAKTHIDFNIGIGTPGFYYGPSYGYSPVYDDDCHYVKVKKWVKYKGAWHKKYVKKLVCY
jgi:ABC-type sugar transport system substrate-binding protein